MLRFTVLMMGMCVLTLAAAGVMAETSTTKVESPDGTTTVIVPEGPGSSAVVSSNGKPSETEVIITPRPAVDAITGKPASRTTAEPKKNKEESLRDRVREKME